MHTEQHLKIAFNEARMESSDQAQGMGKQNNQPPAFMSWLGRQNEPLGITESYTAFGNFMQHYERSRSC